MAIINPYNEQIRFFFVFSVFGDPENSDIPSQTCTGFEFFENRMGPARLEIGKFDFFWVTFWFLMHNFTFSLSYFGKYLHNE